MNYDALKKLTEVHAVTGDTKYIQEFIKQKLNDLKIEFEEDGYGAIIAGNLKNYKMIIAAHIDEVGFQITKLNEDGTLRVLPIGWVFPNRLDHAPVYVMDDSGNKVPGTIFHNAILKSENIETFANLTLNVGAESIKELQNMKISVGNLGTFKKEWWETENSIFASSLDNKVSVFAIFEIIKADKNFLKDKIIVFHTDEEMRDHSANSVAANYNAEFAMILDYCPVHQTFDDEDVFPEESEGPFVIYRGGGHMIHEGLRQTLNELTDIPKAFISNNTLPGLEPDNFQNNGTTKAFNFCIPAQGYHGQIYTVRKNNIQKFIDSIQRISKKILESK